jgi:anti-anti-sigma regulatory factor
MTLAGKWNIENAEELQGRLTGSLDPNEDIVLDLAGVASCDTAALQLLWSLRRTALERGLGFRVAAMSPAIVEIAGALGLPLRELTDGAGNGL